MATHYHKIRGKTWKCLTGFNSLKDHELFAQGGKLYDKLFSEEEKEPYEHFKRYIEDSAKARKRPQQAKVIDTLSVGFEEEVPKGFIFFSWYPDEHLVFTPYVGFYLTTSLKFFQTVPDLIEEEREIVGLHGKSIEAVLFELEKFNPSDIPLKGSLTTLTKKQLVAKKRAQLTRAYQENGAWLIPWIIYKQPPLEKKGRSIDMHLMYWPVNQEIQSNPGKFEKQHVEKLVRFTYERFYLDGYKATEPAKDHKYWQALMKQYVNEVIKYIPDGEFELERISAKEPTKRVFISYAGRDERFADLIRLRFETRGASVNFWPLSIQTKIGQKIENTIKELIREADHCIFLVTPNSFGSYGQRLEKNVISSYAKRKPIHIITDISHDDLNSLFKVSGDEGFIYARFHNDYDFSQAVDKCVRSIFDS